MIQLCDRIVIKITHSGVLIDGIVWMVISVDTDPLVALRINSITPS